MTLYLDVNAPAWGYPIQSTGRERGFQSFTFHPQFGQPGSPGFGRFYTYLDTTSMAATPDFPPSGGDKPTHDTVLLEWTAKTPTAATYDGGAPKVDEDTKSSHPGHFVIYLVGKEYGRGSQGK